MVILALGVACACVALTFVMNGYALGLAQMGLAGITLHAVRQLFLVNHGVSWLAGAMGEESTDDILRAASRRRWITGAVRRIAIDGADIDHLVVLREWRDLVVG